MIKKIKQIICRLFHQDFWVILDVFDNNIFEYYQLYCPKCDWVFYDNPFDLDGLSEAKEEHWE